MKLSRFTLTFIGILVAVLLFYWFQLRPSVAKTECDKKARDYFQTNSSAPISYYNSIYQACLHSKGL